MNRLSLTVIGALLCSVPASAQVVTRRANVSGNAVDGKCTIEVNVDGAAEVEVRGDQGRMRNLSGQRATWRRFVCNGRMPLNPNDFRFRGIDGRGQVQLIRDPRQNNGTIVFRIDDPDGGREGYTVDLEWRGSNGSQWSNQDSRGWRGPAYDRDNNRDYRGDRRDDRRGGNYDRRYYDESGRWNAEGTTQAVRICENAVTDRIQREGYQNITFRQVVPDNNPGRNDFVNGTATARRSFWRSSTFQFSCSVDLATGQVRTVDVNGRR